MSARVRMTPEEVHANHHRLITDRVDAYLTHSRGARSRLARREAWKLALWTLRSHINAPHGQHNLSPLLSLDELIAIHDHIHGDES